MISRRQAVLATAAATLGGASFKSALGADYPVKAVRIIIPFPPGGSTDVGARMIAARLSADFKQPVVVENKPGAGTTIASAYVASMPADGYTLYYTGSGTHVVAQALYKKLPYNALTSFASVGMVNTSPFVVVVNPASPYKTLKELFDAGRAAPNKLAYASTGSGALPHLANEMILRAVGVQATHVPYQGAGPAMNALLGAQVDFMVTDVGVVPFVKSGQLRALAVTTSRESEYFPGVPSLAQAGVPNMDIPSGQALLAPAGTPATVVGRINESLNAALKETEVQQRFAQFGLTVAPGSPEVLARFLETESDRYNRVVQQLGISLD